MGGILEYHWGWRRPAKALFLVQASLLTLALTGCAARGGLAAEGVVDDDRRLVEQAVNAQRWSEAEAPLARLLQRDLRNASLQFLHALALEQQALTGDRSRLEQAAVGYESTLRFAPGHYASLLKLGVIALEQQNHAEAQRRFAEAVLDQPSRWEAFYGLGVASYYLQDLPLLTLAAGRAAVLAPERADVLRLRAFALAAAGDSGAQAAAVQAAAADSDIATGAFVVRRVADYGIQSPAWEEEPAILSAGTDPTLSDAASQVVVEVTLLLNSRLTQENRGINLFDGLRVLYGYSNTLVRTADSFGRNSVRTITSEISSPRLDYSLNLFNDAGQTYSVVARPSITAHLDRESSFFAGRTLNVEVSGVNLGTLQPIDVGVELRVLPERISADQVTFQVTAERSFLSQDQIGTFERSLTTFRQRVSATADIRFGETLVLSALSEQVSDRTFSRVPWIGRVPIVDWFTSRRSDTRRQESLLILVTPKAPLNLQTPDDPLQRAAAAQHLLDTWNQRIEPGADLQAVTNRVRQMHWLRKPEAGDLRLRVTDVRAQRADVAEALMLAWQ